jgi:hypothetical protein
MGFEAIASSLHFPHRRKNRALPAFRTVDLSFNREPQEVYRQPIHRPSQRCRQSSGGVRASGHACTEERLVILNRREQRKQRSESLFPPFPSVQKRALANAQRSLCVEWKHRRTENTEVDACGSLSEFHASVFQARRKFVLSSIGVSVDSRKKHKKSRKKMQHQH